ncbi:hypothetical protein HWI79_1913 [Cryptosporidium felis]|nr:hypothetical protein HWI79_1913 [Cryptosporidium felis]
MQCRDASRRSPLKTCSQPDSKPDARLASPTADTFSGSNSQSLPESGAGQRRPHERPRGSLGREGDKLAGKREVDSRGPVVPGRDGPADGLAVLPGRQKQIRVYGRELDGHDSLLVRGNCLLEGVGDVSEVPKLERRIPVIVIANHNLSGLAGDPGQSGWSTALGGISEGDCAFLKLEIPNSRSSVSGGRGHYVGNFGVPLQGSYVRASMLVLLSGLTVIEVGGEEPVIQVHDVDLAIVSPGCEEVVVSLVELETTHCRGVDGSFTNSVQEELASGASGTQRGVPQTQDFSATVCDFERSHTQRGTQSAPSQCQEALAVPGGERTPADLRRRDSFFQQHWNSALPTDFPQLYSADSAQLPVVQPLPLYCTLPCVSPSQKFCRLPSLNHSLSSCPLGSCSQFFFLF